MKKLFTICILLNPIVLWGQDNTAKLFETTLIKADIDTLVSKLKEYHPTFLVHYQENNLQNKIDSIKKKEPLNTALL